VGQCRGPWWLRPNKWNLLKLIGWFFGDQKLEKIAPSALLWENTWGYEGVARRVEFKVLKTIVWDSGFLISKEEKAGYISHKKYKKSAHYWRRYRLPKCGLFFMVKGTGYKGRNRDTSVWNGRCSKTSAVLSPLPHKVTVILIFLDKRILNLIPEFIFKFFHGFGGAFSVG